MSLFVLERIAAFADVLTPLASSPWKDPALLQSGGYPEPVLPGPDR